jgi:elongation of very long chain fatty acids protein 4
MTDIVTEKSEELLTWLNDGPSPEVTKDWFGASPTMAFGIAAAYLAMVFFGRLYMKSRATPIATPNLKFLYNLTQMLACAYMTVESALQAYRSGYTLFGTCNAFNKAAPPVGLVLHMFYVSKILDFADTAFIILGQKWKQLSFLHVYHHTTIFLIYWMNLRLNYDGDIWLTIFLNGMVHFFMYTYYFLALHTPKIWWKKYLTMFQMVQFLCMNAQAMHMLYKGCDQVPKKVTQMYLVYIQTLFWLFFQFFVSSYGKKSGGGKGGTPRSPAAKKVE